MQPMKGCILKAGPIIDQGRDRTLRRWLLPDIPDHAQSLVEG
jgi:hypothetical protein